MQGALSRVAAADVSNAQPRLLITDRLQTGTDDEGALTSTGRQKSSLAIYFWRNLFI